MKYYISTTEFNCGIDLHARQMYACVMDRQGNKLVHTNINGNDFSYFLRRVEPYAERHVAKRGMFKGNAILANKIARAVYFMLQNGTGFDAERVIATSI